MTDGIALESRHDPKYDNLPESLIEARARAIDPEAWGRGKAGGHQRMSIFKARRASARVAARATLAADRELGYKSIKREPTKAMREAGGGEAWATSDREQAARLDWCAMWDAAPDLGEG